MKVAILGSSGMLGSMVKSYMEEHTNFELLCVGRPTKGETPMGDHLALTDIFDLRASDLVGCHWIVNCIGVIKPFIKDDNPSQVINAININSRLPYHLSTLASEIGAHIIQIATDCVYSGTVGGYDEHAPHDAIDVYGKTKSLGESNVENITHIRASIIGPERNYSRSLIEWFRNQEQNAIVTGFNNHLWNGVTTLQFAKVCSGLIRSGNRNIRKQHLVPNDIVNKYELLKYFASLYDRQDIDIRCAPAPVKVDRTLTTIDMNTNNLLWELAGYQTPPTIEKMVMELKSNA